MVKLVEMCGVEPQSLLKANRIQYIPENVFVNLFLSPEGCRRVLTPRCSMLSHLQKEQSLGRFELTFSNTKPLALRLWAYLEYHSKIGVLARPKLKGHNEILKNYNTIMTESTQIASFFSVN